MLAVNAEFCTGSLDTRIMDNRSSSLVFLHVNVVPQSRARWAYLELSAGE